MLQIASAALIAAASPQSDPPVLLMASLLGMAQGLGDNRSSSLKAGHAPTCRLCVHLFPTVQGLLSLLLVRCPALDTAPCRAHRGLGDRSPCLFLFPRDHPTDLQAHTYPPSLPVLVQLLGRGLDGASAVDSWDNE